MDRGEPGIRSRSAGRGWRSGQQDAVDRRRAGARLRGLRSATHSRLTEPSRRRKLGRRRCQDHDHAPLLDRPSDQRRGDVRHEPSLSPRGRGANVFLTTHKTRGALSTWVDDWLNEWLARRQRVFGPKIFACGTSQCLETRPISGAGGSTGCSIFRVRFECGRPTLRVFRDTFRAATAAARRGYSGRKTGSPRSLKSAVVSSGFKIHCDLEFNIRINVASH
jgi:hypothetical protein